MKPDTILIDGRAYSWKALCEVRRQQIEAWRAARGAQPALFEMKEDCRPAAERSAAGRYEAPTFLDSMRGETGGEERP